MASTPAQSVPAAQSGVDENRRSKGEGDTAWQASRGVCGQVAQLGQGQRPERFPQARRPDRGAELLPADAPAAGALGVLRSGHLPALLAGQRGHLGRPGGIGVAPLALRALAVHDRGVPLGGAVRAGCELEPGAHRLDRGRRCRDLGPAGLGRGDARSSGRHRRGDLRDRRPRASCCHADGPVRHASAQPGTLREESGPAASGAGEDPVGAVQGRPGAQVLQPAPAAAPHARGGRRIAGPEDRRRLVDGSAPRAAGVEYARRGDRAQPAVCAGS